MTDVHEGGETSFLLEGKNGTSRLTNIDYTKCDTGIKVRCSGWASSGGVVLAGACSAPLAIALRACRDKGAPPALAHVLWPHRHAHTHAPMHPGVQYKPRKGDALLFWDVMPDGHLDRHALHGGCPVVTGEKWVATKWYRSKCMRPDCKGDDSDLS